MNRWRSILEAWFRSLARGSPSYSVPRLVASAIIVGVIGAGIVWVAAVYDIRRGNEASRRAVCHGSLSQIGLALQNYYQEHRSYPPVMTKDRTGRPLHSWRVLLLPYMDESDLFKRIKLEEPWDSPYNLSVTHDIPSVYRCPADRSENTTDTSYLAVAGPNGAYSARIAPIKRELPSDALIVVEVAASRVRWNQPRDFEVADAQVAAEKPSHNFKIGSNHRGGAMVLRADGTVEFLDETISPEVVFERLTGADTTRDKK